MNKYIKIETEHYLSTRDKDLRDLDGMIGVIVGSTYFLDNQYRAYEIYVIDLTGNNGLEPGQNRLVWIPVDDVNEASEYEIKEQFDRGYME